MVRILSHVVHSKDDVVAVLIHLGYLSFDPDKSECYIPNKEVRIEMTNAVEATGWKRLNDALSASEKLYGIANCRQVKGLQTLYYFQEQV